jgi:uncharacterized membrane protein YedE/YeeE
MKQLLFIAFGALFGFLLSRAQATDYEAIAKMFALSDFHLFGVIGVAIASATVGLFVLRRSGATALGGDRIAIRPKPMHRGVFAGGLIFGAGWAIAGACPGTALAQIGEGKLYAFATVAGILLGTWLQRRVASRGKSPAAQPNLASAG